MIRTFFAALVVASISPAGAATARPVDVASLPNPAAVLATLERVGDWQIANPSRHPFTDWTSGAGFAGVMALAGVSSSPRFHDAAMRLAEAAGWDFAKEQFRSFPYDADGQAIGQTYLELYFQHRDPRMIARVREHLDFILAHPSSMGLEFDRTQAPRHLERWSWCDALFMAPPTWIRAHAATGKTAYLDFMVKEWWATSDYLYDRDEHLYFRDSTYFDQREANGKKVFWSRGNGWVIAGLARVLDYLPTHHPDRPRFEQQFREMAAKIAKLQQPDGFWRASLLDPESYPLQETSGTAFFTYGLFWGVKRGLLDRATYLPPALKGWAALVGCVQPDGKLTHVQPIGASPKSFDPESTEIYGVGAFLLAGAELYRLGERTAAPAAK